MDTCGVRKNNVNKHAIVKSHHLGMTRLFITVKKQPTGIQFGM